MSNSRQNGILPLSLTVVLLLACPFVGQSPTATQPEEYRLSLAVPPVERATMQAKLRWFLWSHLNDHAIGTVKATWFTVEGEPSTYTYDVNPQATSIWKIYINVERHRYGGYSGSHTPKEFIAREKYVADSVRIVTTGHSATATTTKPTVDFFKSHKIQLVDGQGKVIQEI